MCDVRTLDDAYNADYLSAPATLFLAYALYILWVHAQHHTYYFEYLCMMLFTSQTVPHVISINTIFLLLKKSETFDLGSYADTPLSADTAHCVNVQ
jgi:hypothetical protein